VLRLTPPGNGDTRVASRPAGATADGRRRTQRRRTRAGAGPGASGDRGGRSEPALAVADGGRVVERFSASDPSRKGVKIGGKAGQSIVAAAGGTVVYSGSGLVGYGQLIIIKHNNII